MWVYTKIMQECSGSKVSYRGRQVPLRLILDPASSLSRSFPQVTEPVLVPDTLSLLPNAHTSHTDSSHCVPITLVTRIRRTWKQHAAALKASHNFEVQVFNACVIEHTRTAFNSDYCTVENRKQLHPNRQFRIWRWIVKLVITLHRVKVRKTWSYTSAPSYIFNARC